MKTPPVGNRRLRSRLFPALRICASALLAVMLVLEILPIGYGENIPAASQGDAEDTFRIEPLQVCDFGDPPLGGIFDLPVLVSDPPLLLLSSEALPLVLHAIAFVPDGFHPSVDRPPRLFA